MLPRVTFDELFGQIPAHIQARPGHVFHSGRGVLHRAAEVYLLGLNPAGSAESAAVKGLTVQKQMRDVLDRPDEFSEYVDHSWNGRPIGGDKIQKRVVHLLNKIRQNPRSVPSSNAVFCCTEREADLKAEKAMLLQACWPFHLMLIQKLDVRAVICMGRTAGGWVRRQLGANECIDVFVEQNNRRWKSRAHRNSAGRLVFTLAHPGIADWTCPHTDPSGMVARVLNQFR